MTDWKKEAERLYFEKKLTWDEITQIITFEGLPPEKCRNKIRDYIRTTERYKQEHQKTNVVGVFSDVHIPFDHPNYLQFLKDTFKKHNITTVVCVGDLVDNHAISDYKPNPCSKGAYDELDMAIERCAEYVKAFKRVKMVLGNHDLRPFRQAATIGMGERFLKPINELLHLPKTWEIVGEELIIDNVLYKHGINCGGKDGAINSAMLERMSTVIGHSHSFGGCKYSANKRDIVFGLNVGCGIDIDTYAFEYGSYSKYRPTLGCGIVFSDSSAMFVPMGKEYFRG